MKKLYRELKGATFANGARVGHIGASDIPCMFGVGFKSPLQWAIEKREELINGPKPQEENLLFDMGHALEPVIAKGFISRHPEYTLDRGYEKDRIFERIDNPLFHCTPDRFLNHRAETLELKYDSMGKYYYNSPDDYCLNEGYLWQKQYQLWFFTCIKGWLAWISNFGKLSDMHISYSKKYGERIVEEAPAIWEDTVLNGNDPQVTCVEDTTICKHTENPITATEDVRHYIEELNRLTIEMNIKQNELGYNDKENGFEALKNKVKIYMANNDVLLDSNGQVLATFGGKRRMFKLK